MTNIAFPNADNSITASLKIFSLRIISFLLRFLSFGKWFKSRMSMPIFSIDLKNCFINHKVNKEIRLNKFLPLVFYTEGFKDKSAFYFWRARLGQKPTLDGTIKSSSVPRIMDFMNGKFFSACFTLFCRKVFWSSLAWFWLTRSVFRSTLRRTITWISVCPFLKFFPAPQASKYTFFGKVWLLVVSIRACLRTERSIYSRWHPKDNLAFLTGYKLILAFNATLHRAEARNPFFSPITKNFMAYFACRFHDVIIARILNWMNRQPSPTVLRGWIYAGSEDIVP